MTIKRNHPLEWNEVSFTRKCLLLLITASIGVVHPANASAKTKGVVHPANSSVKTKGVVPSAKVNSAKHPLQKSLTVSEWFTRYDQIRRDAEMTMGDKWQALSLLEKKPNKKNSELATHMLKKYTSALSQIKELGATPETKELQTGYVEYFTKARQLFANYVTAQKVVPFTNQSMGPAKKELEELDKRNKKLDDELRKKYIIDKHKHS